MPDRSAIRRRMTAALAAGVLIVAGCGGDAEDDTTSGRVPESGTLPSTTTTSAPDEGETTTTLETERPPVTAPNAETARIEVDVEEGEATTSSIAPGGDPTSEPMLEVDVDTPVQLAVTSDQPGRVLVHGYNLVTDVGPDAEGTLEFVADAPGLFLIELESIHLPLVRLDVAP